jgi:large subunit ribosomal protein L18
MIASKARRRKKIKQRVRKRINGTSDIPRLSVFRSNKAIYAQVIDDTKGLTLLSASSKGISKGTGVEIALQVGKSLAEQARANGIETVVFDRNGYLYHGRVKSLAEGAREGGLKF